MTLECAGNGRAFFDPPVAGIQWGKGAVGTARWTGVRLADVLKRAGVRSTGRFVLMNGADRPLGTMPDFVRQVPIDKAMHPDTLIAYEMNGQPIPPLHGFPLRAIIPGLGRRVLDQVADQPARRRSRVRRLLGRHRLSLSDQARGAGRRRRSEGHGAAHRPGRQVADHQPLDGATVAPGKIDVAGFAWAGETDIARVDISTDHGASWQPARLVGEQAQLHVAALRVHVRRRPSRSRI